MSRSAVRWSSAIIVGLLALAVVAGAITWSNRMTPPALGTNAGQAWSGNGLRIPFRWCPPGTFQMGSPVTEALRREDEEQVSVTLTHGFWLGQTEVTQGQWQSVMETTPWKGKDGVNEGTNSPAVYVSHSGEPDSAVAFCEQFTLRERAAGRLPSDWEYRLPTEAEWEYACRAGTTTAFSFGDNPTHLDQYVWSGGNSKESLEGTESWLEDCVLFAHPVGNKLGNLWGLRDMHGNIWEWCEDEYEQSLPGGADPRVMNQDSDRIYRGGGWNNPPWESRSASRAADSPSERSYFLGFRLALSPSGPWSRLQPPRDPANSPTERTAMNSATAATNLVSNVTIAVGRNSNAFQTSTAPSRTMHCR